MLTKNIYVDNFVDTWLFSLFLLLFLIRFIIKTLNEIPFYGQVLFVQDDTVDKRFSGNTCIFMVNCNIKVDIISVLMNNWPTLCFSGILRSPISWQAS